MADGTTHYAKKVGDTQDKEKQIDCPDHVKGFSCQSTNHEFARRTTTLDIEQNNGHPHVKNLK